MRTPRAVALLALLGCSSGAGTSGEAPVDVTSEIVDGHLDVQVTYRSSTRWVHRVELVDPDGVVHLSWRMENWEEDSSGPAISVGVGVGGGRRDEEEGGRGGGLRVGGGGRDSASRAQGVVEIPNAAHYRRTSGRWILRVVLIDRAGETQTAEFPAPQDPTDPAREAREFGRAHCRRVSERGRILGDPDRITVEQVEAWTRDAPDEGETKGLARWFEERVLGGAATAAFRDEFVRGFADEKARSDGFVVRSVSGAAAFRPSGSTFWRRVEPGDAIPSGAELRTGPVSSVVLEVPEGRLRLESDSGTTLSSRASIELRYGEVRIRSAGSDPRAALRVSTPNSACGMIGARTGIRYESSRDETTVTAYEGTVDLRHLYTGETRTLSAERAFVRPASLETSPAPDLPEDWWPLD